MAEPLAPVAIEVRERYSRSALACKRLTDLALATPACLATKPACVRGRCRGAPILPGPGPVPTPLPTPLPGPFDPVSLSDDAQVRQLQSQSP